MFFLLFIITVCIAAYTYMKSQDIKPGDFDLKGLLQGKGLFNTAHVQQTSKPKEIEYDRKEQPVFAVCSGTVIMCGKNYVRGLDSDGKQKWSENILVSNPVVKSAGSFMVIADIRGRSFFTFKDNTLKWNKELESSLVNIEVSESGYISAVRESEEGKAVLTVYDQYGNDIFTSFIGEYEVLSAKVSPDGDTLVLNSIDTRDDSSNTVIEFRDMRGRVINTRELDGNTLFPLMYFTDDETVLSISESSSVCTGKSNKNGIKDLNTSGRRIYSAGVQPGRYAVIAFEDESKSAFTFGGATELKIFDLDGRQPVSVSIDGDVRGMEVSRECIAVHTGRDVYFIDAGGKLLGKYSAKTDIRNIFFVDKHNALVVTRSNIAVVPIKNI